MSSYQDIFPGIAFFFLVPLTLIAGAALWVCITFTEAESQDGVLTDGGKRMVRSRVFLGIGFAIYCVLLLGYAFASGGVSMSAFWVEHWVIQLVLMVAADASTIVAVVYGFQVRGSRSWIIHVATILLAIPSTLVTLLLLLGVQVSQPPILP